MAIAFNLPSERETTEENFSRLNRLLAELYEVLCHILVARQPGQEAHDNRRDRPYSESDIPSETSSPRNQPNRLSASSPPLSFSLESELEDDVFFSPRSNQGSDPFSSRNLDIFGYGSPRTPAGVLICPRNVRTFTFSVDSEKYWKDKGGTRDATTENSDVTDAASPGGSSAASDRESSDASIISSIIPNKVSGSICTAILLMLGWKLLSYKR